MKKIILVLCTLVFTHLSFAESAEEAFSRELQYLQLQKESLLKLKKDIISSKNQRIVKAKTAIATTENELAKIQLSNQELVEEYKALEKITKDSSQLSSQLDKNSLKINELLTDVSPKLGLQHTEFISNDSVSKFEKNLEQFFVILENMSKYEWREHAFINEKDELVKGEVLFIGLHSAWGKYNNKIYPMAPYNKDFLKVITNASDNDLYIFSPDFQKVNILSAKTWKESVADSVPGVVMTLIMIAVFGLFIMLAKA